MIQPRRTALSGYGVSETKHQKVCVLMDGAYASSSIDGIISQAGAQGGWTFKAEAHVR